MSQDERQKSGAINLKRSHHDLPHNHDELFSNLIDPKTSPEIRHLPTTSATTSNKIHNHHQVTQPQQTTTTSAASNAMSNTQTKLVANLHSAANDGKVELVRLLLRCGADVNAQDEQFGNTALHQAAWNGFSETVQVLCKYRANTSIRNKAQFTPLHMAAQQGHNQTARLLLMASAKTEAKNSYGDTPLHTAARYGHAGVARILLSAKSNPNQVNKNHDTPLHIAAAMGRRKLTKIFMQNGAEPAIKNKQNETPMDIALRKDLVDIQELIANPPPMAPNANSSKSRRQTSESPHHAHLSQLEQRFGQLYSGTSPQQQQQVVLKTKHRHKSRQRHLSRRHTHLSSEDDSNELEQRMQRLRLHQSDASMHKRLQKCQKGAAFRVRGGDAQHLVASSASFLRCAKMAVDELAVDVPDDDFELRHAKRADNYNGKLLVNNRGAAFSSLHSLAPVESLKPRNDAGQLGARNFWMKTIEDLSNHPSTDVRFLAPHLSNGDEAKDVRKRQLKGGAVTECNGVTSSLELSGQSATGEACPPDACDNPDDWADIMAKSALYRSTNSPVIESQLESHNDSTKINLARNAHSKMLAASAPPASSKIKLPSPAGSIISSLSKSHGRILVRRRKQKASFLVRKPNLGTCVGKLSLLKLRGIVNKRPEVTKNSNELEVDNEEALFDEQIEDSKQNEDEAEKQQHKLDEMEMEVKREEAKRMGDKSAKTTTTTNKVPNVAQRKTPVAAGRRQERIERLEHSCAALLAPNGSQLVRTRPLASLNDDTQLYAVPKKTKQLAKQQEIGSDGALGNNSKQEQRLEASCAATLDNPAATGERVPSGGPALTSDGGDRSSVDSSSSSFARITPHSSSSAIASSSDECIESMDLVCVNQKRTVKNQTTTSKTTASESKRPAVVGVHVVGETDLYAPGYSVIRTRTTKVGPENRSAGSSEACLCKPYGEQKESESESIKTGEKITLMEHDEMDSKVKAANKSSSNQSERQPANGIKQQKSNNCNGEQVKTTSKLRQLLHLDSRTKSGMKLNGHQHNEKVTTNKTTIRETESEDKDNQDGKLCVSRQNNLDSGKDEPDNNETTSQSRLPLTAIAGGYYAYSPVVQSAYEVKSSKSSDVTKTSKTLQQESNNKSGSKKNWLMSKFSMSSNNGINKSNQLIDSTGSKQSLIADVKGRLISEEAESGADGGASINSNTLLGPERKAELINIIGADLRDTTNKSLNNGGQEFVSTPLHQQLDHAHSDDNSSSSVHLIRPKNVFSTTSADLIAAQKSLAAAAAEKVNRDRMVKMCSNGSNMMDNFIGSDSMQTNDNDDDDDDLTTSKESVLTVKTCDPFWSTTVGHVVNHQPIVAQNGINHQNYLIGQNQLVNHRSGTNSVGMSDSSPSNNGAESDNSIQTTTGSANTDTTTSGGIGSGCADVNGTAGRSNGQLMSNSNKSQEQRGPSSPLGILSRILLNNKSFGHRTTASSAIKTKTTTTTTTTTLTTNKENESLNSVDSKTKEPQFMQTANGSLSSSSALSSPSSNSNSPATTTASSTAIELKTSKQKLDQLTSRSRCPIVLTKSNGLPSETEEYESQSKREEGEKKSNESKRKININDSSPGVGGNSDAPPLPAKGVLKMPSSRTLIQNNFGANKSAASNGAMSSILLADSMNGLPRVSSYTQISSSLDQCPSSSQHFYACNNPNTTSNSKQLCNYHLLNNQRNNQTQLQPQYNPYSSSSSSATATSKHSGLHNDRYCQDSTCKEFMNKNGNRYHLEQLHQQHSHRMSHHDLRSTADTTTSSLADLTALPASAAINYEYYLESSPFLQHHFAHNGENINHPNSQSCNYTTTTSAANNNSIHYLNYAHDDSIYIPDFLMAPDSKNSNKIRDISSNGSVGANELSRDDSMSRQSNFFPNHLHFDGKHQLFGRPRPKSSLDTPFISSSGVNQHYPSPSISTTNNGRHFSANLSNNRPALATETTSAANLQHHPLLLSSSKNHFPSAQDHSSHQMNSGNSNSKSESQQNSPSSVGNQSLLSNHNIGHFEYKQQLPTYYSYSSPYHNAHNHNAYLYSENSIYASDQSVAFNRSSDLTVLPTISAETNNVDSFNANPKQTASIEAKVSLASGGYSNNSGADNMVTCSTGSNNTRCPSSPASNQNDRSRTPKAQQQQAQQQVVERNSWMPNQPYKSLIQIRQLSSAKPNQSQSVSESTGQRTSSSGSTNNQLNGGIEKDSYTKAMGTILSPSESKGPIKVFISNRAQGNLNEFEDKNDPSTKVPVLRKNASTVL